MSFFGKSKDEDKKTKKADDEKIYLRQEELDITKDKVHVGDVEFSKEIIEEQKIVDVPVTREEVVIQRRAIDNEPSDLPVGHMESIHIPINEERVEVGKHTVITGEVSAKKREIKETRHVEETLKREEARVHEDGDAHLVNEEDK
jgi:uncharacterized protein (TIGR02271 family)